MADKGFYYSMGQYGFDFYVFVGVVVKGKTIALFSSSDVYGT
jgi:hypothetical protein